MFNEIKLYMKYSHEIIVYTFLYYYMGVCYQLLLNRGLPDNYVITYILDSDFGNDYMKSK